MKKLKLNCPLHHKAYSHDTVQVQVEKVITLYGSRFQQMRDHPLEDCPEIAQHKDLMYMAEGVAHCLLFIDSKTGDGLLVEAEGYDYARNSHFVPNARAIVEQNNFTAGERELYAELEAMADSIAELAHTGQRSFCFDDMLGDANFKELMIQAVAEMLHSREDLAQVQKHSLGIWGQPDFTVIAKPVQEMKLYCPLVIQAEPEYDEADFDYDNYEIIPSSCACGLEDEINEAIQKYSEPNEKHRGLMVYYDETSLVNEKVFSAFPSVEVRNGELVGVLTCQIAEPLTDSEMKEFCVWWEGQAADGYGEGFEQREIDTEQFGTVYVSFWNSSDDWRIQTEMQQSSTDVGFEEEEILTMDDMPMGGMV